MDDGEVINNDDSTFRIKFNGIKVFVYVDSGSPDRGQNAWPDYYSPFTEVEASMQNVTDASSLGGTIALVGRVYGEE